MHATKEAFLGTMDGGRLLDSLFSDSGGTYFFAKDRDFRFTMCNRTLLEKLGLESEEQILGKDDYLFFERSVADRYREEDEEVMNGRRPITNRIWLVPNARGVMEVGCWLPSDLP